MRPRRNILRKITRGLGKGISKVGASSQIFQLKGQKWMLVRQRDVLFRELGKMVYELRLQGRFDIETVISGKIAELKEMDRCLSEVVDQLKELGDVMREPLLPEEEPIFPCICGAVFMENERFCSRCGRSEEEAIAAFAEKERRAGEKMICPDCSSHISRGLVFCPFCGAALDRPGW